MSQQPLDLIGQQRARLARVECALVFQCLAMLVLTVTGAWYVWRGLPVYFVPPGGPGVAMPGTIPDGVATDFASRCLKSRYGFTPASIKAAQAEFLSCLHPTLLVVFKTQAEKELLLVKDGQLSTQTVVENTTVSSRTQDEVTVLITARRAVWIGGHQVRDEPLQATLTVAPWVHQGSPSGLVITKVSITPALSVSGT
jgi:hypothetical protein